jgi:tetratricopeptide (TPR) repeat protein
MAAIEGYSSHMRINKLLQGGIYLLGITIIFPISAANSAGYEPSTPAPIATTPTSTPSTSATPIKTVATELTKVNSLLAKKDFRGARTALLLLDKEFANNADINNLLGYSSRKLMDYRASATFYTKALRINPNHLGAIEYQGELFVITKKIAAAKKNLKTLERLCGLNCAEYKDLKKAIGNR